jgi:hypothetical protein
MKRNRTPQDFGKYLWLYLMHFVDDSTDWFMTVKTVCKFWKQHSVLLIPMINVIINSTHNKKHFWLPHANKIKTCNYYNEDACNFSDFPFRIDPKDPLPFMTNLKKLTIVNQPMTNEFLITSHPILETLIFQDCWIEFLNLTFPNLVILRFINCWSSRVEYINIGTVQRWEIYFNEKTYKKWELKSIMQLVRLSMLDNGRTHAQLSSLLINAPNYQINVTGIESIKQVLDTFFS